MTSGERRRMITTLSTAADCSRPLWMRRGRPVSHGQQSPNNTPITLIRLVIISLTVTTKARSVARSLNLRHVDLGYTLMGDHQGRPGTVSLGQFVGVDLNI